ncbi:MAG: phospholipase, partial [bacterium]
MPERPRPDRLVVHFHGAGGTAASGLALWQGAATAYGLVVLLPQSAGRTWDLILRAPGPDVAATDARLGEVFGTYRPTRIAFAGFFDGATYALALGLANGDLVDGGHTVTPELG